jgi:hypothetical protein
MSEVYELIHILDLKVLLSHNKGITIQSTFKIFQYLIVLYVLVHMITLQYQNKENHIQQNNIFGGVLSTPPSTNK